MVTAGAGKFDILVAGSGAAGLVAALAAADAGARVLLVESASELGGTTALGGGRVWVPANHTEANRGDTIAAARQYLRAIFDPAYPELLEAFLESAPEMVRFVERRSAHRFRACPNYPDYHPDLPGFTLGGRCLDMEPISLGELVEEVALVRTPPAYLPISHAEWEAWRMPVRFDHSLLAGRLRGGVRTNGVALVAGLLDGVIRAGVRVRRGTALESWTDGLAELRHEGGLEKVPAPTVVLATGGVDGDPSRWGGLPTELRVSAAAPSNFGAGLRIAEAAGARLDNLGEGWWMPMLKIPGDQLDGRPYPRGVIRERGLPRQIVVDRQGRRFVDEAAPYNDFVKGMHRAGAGEAFWVFDEGFHQRYAIPGVPAGDAVPGWVRSAPTLAELAGALGVDPGGLEATVARWNGFCDGGRDLDFGRGDNPYDRYYGDPDQPGNRCLGPIGEPPFYAVPIYAGMIGTRGGPVTDADGQVLRADGTSCAGLYAIGNAGAFWTGSGYPGPGATLAIGMTMGYRAGRAAAAALPRQVGGVPGSAGREGSAVPVSRPGGGPSRR